MRQNSRRCLKKYFIILLVVFVSTYLYTSFFLVPTHGFVNLHAYFEHLLKGISSDDISCYRIKDEAANVSVDDRCFREKSIFFIESGCQKHVLTLRKACAIEAAATRHPQRQIVLLHTRPLEDLRSYQKILDLLKLPNLEFARLNVDTYTKDTPLQKYFRARLGRRTRKYKLAAELLKLLTLQKFGGTVLDLDMILAKPLDYLGANFIAFESEGVLGTAIIGADSELGKGVAEKALKYINDQPFINESSVQIAITEAVKFVFSIRDLKNMTRCNGFEIYESKYFYPLNRTSSENYYQPGELIEHVFGYHLWDSDNIMRTSVPANSLFVKITSQNCPDIYNMFIKNYVQYSTPK